jgi:hypothetical protein
MIFAADDLAEASLMFAAQRREPIFGRLGFGPRATRSATIPAPERDEIELNRHPALTFCLSMIFSENRFSLFGIML